MKRMTLATTSIIGALAVTLSGCVDTERSSSPEAADGGNSTECPWEPDESVDSAVRIAWQASPTGDLVVKDKRVLEGCMPNATINWEQYSSGGDVVQAFGANSADIGLVGSSPAARAVSAPLELPVKVIWIYEVIGAAESLVARDPAVTDVAGLKDKTVGVPFGSTAHYSLLTALSEENLIPDTDVKLINLEPEAMAPAWQQEQIDAVWIWNPVLGELETNGGSMIASSADTAEAGKPTYDVAMGTTAFIDENTEFMNQWAKAQDYAVKLINEEPKDASESMAAVLGVSPTEAEGLLDGYEFLPAADQASAEWLDGKMGEDLASTAGFLLEQGSIDGLSEDSVYTDAVDPAPAASVQE